MGKKTIVHDLNNEGRDKVFLDIERMLDDGLAGGSVYMRNDSTNIEEARDLEQEAPPKKL